MKNFTQFNEDLINDKRKFPYIVIVNGGNSDGPGRKEHGEPHFHFSNKSGSFSFSVLIPTVSEWNNSKELYISESNNGYFDWTGLRREKKDLIYWLDEINKDESIYTNIQYIRYIWNKNNYFNKNVKQIKGIK